MLKSVKISNIYQSPSLIADLFSRPLALDPSQSLFSSRGFTGCDLGRQRYFEQIGTCFIEGYNAALKRATFDCLQATALAVPQLMRGFFIEGMAMAAALVDALTFRAERTRCVMSAFGDHYSYLIHVGIGWALAKLRFRPKAILRLLDPVHWWLIHDGRGFCDLYFGVSKARLRRNMVRQDYSAHAYAQGVGRAIWFTTGGEMDRATDAINTLPIDVRGDLWSGLGLAMAYAGPNLGTGDAPHEGVAGPYNPHVAQGAAFGAAARDAAGFIPGHTDDALRIVCGQSASFAASIVKTCRPGSRNCRDQAAYELWRSDVRHSLTHCEGNRHD